MGHLVAQHVAQPGHPPWVPEIVGRHPDRSVECTTGPIAESGHIVEALGAVEHHRDLLFPRFDGTPAEELAVLLVRVLQEHL